MSRRRGRRPDGGSRLKDYVLLELTATLATELSSASGTGLLDLTTRTWSPLALDACDLPADHPPEILPTSGVIKPARQRSATSCSSSMVPP